MNDFLISVLHLVYTRDKALWEIIVILSYSDNNITSSQHGVSLDSRPINHKFGITLEIVSWRTIQTIRHQQQQKVVVVKLKMLHLVWLSIYTKLCIDHRSSCEGNQSRSIPFLGGLIYTPSSVVSASTRNKNYSQFTSISKKKPILPLLKDEHVIRFFCHISCKLVTYEIQSH